MKGSHPRPADRCPFVLGHSISQVTSFMQLGMLCNGNLHTWKDGPYIETWHWFLQPNYLLVSATCVSWQQGYHPSSSLLITSVARTLNQCGFLAGTKQLYECSCLTVRPSIRHTFFTMFPSSYHHGIFVSYYYWQKWCPCKRSRSGVKGQGHRGQNPI